MRSVQDIPHGMIIDEIRSYSADPRKCGGMFTIISRSQNTLKWDTLSDWRKQKLRNGIA